MSNNQKIKACPLCGGDKIVIKTTNYETSYNYKYCVCGKCLTEGPLKINDTDAIKAWNNRHCPTCTDKDKRIEELEQQNRELRELVEVNLKMLKGLSEKGLTIYDVGIWANLPDKDKKIILDQGFELIRLDAQKRHEEIKQQLDKITKGGNEDE